MVTHPISQTKPIWALDPAHSSIEFAVKHLVISTVKGHFGKYEVALDFDVEQPERSHVEARIDAASIDTREAQRDAHLRSADFFDAERHPYLTFTSKRVEPRGDGRYKVHGDLTIRGVTRPVALDAELGGIIKDPWGSRRAGISLEGALNRKDFGLTWNAALETGGLVVGDNVKIAINAELVQQQAQVAQAA